MFNKNFDLIIIGSGPAGLSASIYASRYKVVNLVIGSQFDSYAFLAHKVANFPTEKEISGPEIIQKIADHATAEGGQILADVVIGLEKDSGGFKITTQNNGEFSAKAVLIASGTQHQKLNLASEDKFIGKGLSYCATCDAMFFKNKTVAVIGGSDSANTSSLYLAKIAKQVYQIYRKEALRGEQAWIEQIKNTPNIEVIYNANVKELVGENNLEKIILDNGRELAINGLFVSIGSVPSSALLERLKVETDAKGYIKVGRDQKTNVAGVWAAGDITDGSNNFRQIITACAEGAVAAEDAYKFLSKK